MNQSRFFTRGGIYPFLLCLTHVFLMLCNHETHFGRCLITELTTHSPKMMNDHNHAHAPNTMRCPRAYAMQNDNACISYYMYNVSHPNSRSDPNGESEPGSGRETIYWTGTLYLLYQTLVCPSLITVATYRIQKYKIKLSP